MDGKTADIDGGNTGRGDNGDIFLCVSDKIRKQNGFTSAGLASNEIVAICILEFVVDGSLFRAEFDICESGKDGKASGVRCFAISWFSMGFLSGHVYMISYPRKSVTDFEAPIFDDGDGGALQNKHHAGVSAGVDAVVDAEGRLGAFCDSIGGVGDVDGDVEVEALFMVLRGQNKQSGIT